MKYTPKQLHKIIYEYSDKDFINELIPKIYESNSLNYSNRKEIKVEVG